MPMGTGPQDTGHTPPGPSGGSLLSPSEQRAKISELRAQLAALENTTDAESTAPATPAAAVTPPPAPEPETAPADAQAGAPEIFSHWLHLADGRIIRTLGTVTHWFDSDTPGSKGTPVVAAVANPAYRPGIEDRDATLRRVLAELAALTGVDLSHLAGALK